MGGPFTTTTSRSLCNRSQSSRERTVTRFTILGSCDQPPARCESKSRRKHGRPTELFLFDPQSRKAWTCERRKACWVMASRTTVARRGFNFNFILPERVISESFGHPSALSCAAHLLVRLGVAVQIELQSERRSIRLRAERTQEDHRVNRNARA